VLVQDEIDLPVSPTLETVQLLSVFVEVPFLLLVAVFQAPVLIYVFLPVTQYIKD
jgi:hypothetical protein